MSNVSPLEKLAQLPGMRTEEPLAKHTTFTVGGPAKFFLPTNDVVLVQQAVRLARAAKLPVVALGGGSNTLVSDQQFPGLILHLVSTRCQVNDDGTVDADAGIPLSRVVQATMKKGFGGLEFAVGIPGSFGGALVGNAGTGGHGVAELATQVTFLDAQGEIQTCPRNEMAVAYRHTRFKYSLTDIILSGTLQLAPAAPADIQARVKAALQRRSWQPKGAWCAGCVFKNPTGNHAGKLIEQAGLKGKRIGGAIVSPDHANFVVNTGKATAEEIVMLISYVKQQVRDQFGIQLQEEIRYLGFDTPRPIPA